MQQRLVTLNTAVVRDKFAASGALPASDTPKAFAKIIKDDVEKWTALAKSGGIIAD